MSGREPTVTTEPYSPFDSVERRTQWVPELLAVGVVIAGMSIQANLLGVVSGVALLVIWARLRVEFVFGASVFLFVGLGGGADSTAATLVTTGLAGVLAVALARTWESIRPVVVFLGLFVVAAVGVVAGSGEVALGWVAVGGSLVLALLSYGLYRYERLRSSAVARVLKEEDERPRSDDSEIGSAANRSPGEESDRRSENT